MFPVTPFDPFLLNVKVFPLKHALKLGVDQFALGFPSTLNVEISVSGQPKLSLITKVIDFLPVSLYVIPIGVEFVEIEGVALLPKFQL